MEPMLMFHPRQEVSMKYACLVYVDEAQLENLTVEDQRVLERESAALERDLRRSGHLVHAESLAPIRTATSLRPRRGELSMSDGPVLDARTQLGALYVIEARDLNEALRLGARIPAGRFGAVEVRPLRRADGNVALGAG
jgi:hypothetical protein